MILEGLDKSLEIPLKVEYPPVPPVLTAVQWFFGIAIPAVLSFLAAWGLTEVNTWRLERAREEKRFGKFKLRNYVSLQDFFTARYKNLPATNEEFAAKLRNELLTRRIWEYFPTRKQVALENAIRNYQRAEIGRVLAILFPDWQANIQVAPDRGSRPSMRQRVSGLVRDLKLTARNFLGSQQT